MGDWRFISIVCCGLILPLAAPVIAEQAANEPPAGEGLEIIQRACINCHDIYMITTKRKTPDEWAALVGVMVDRGADVTPEEMQIIEEYLSKNFAISGDASSH
jgi:hypothetical protein